MIWVQLVFGLAHYNMRINVKRFLFYLLVFHFYSDKMNTTTTLIPFLSTQLTQITTTITTTDGSKLLLASMTMAKADTFSPITLSPHWSRLAKLLLISFLSVIGSVGNVFMISSVMVEDHLKKAGKCLLLESN